MAAARPYGGRNPAGNMLSTVQAALQRPLFMVNRKLTMMKKSLPLRFLSHCQHDRMLSSQLNGACCG
jgi:hypothetical protein